LQVLANNGHTFTEVNSTHCYTHLKICLCMLCIALHPYVLHKGAKYSPKIMLLKTELKSYKILELEFIQRHGH